MTALAIWSALLGSPDYPTRETADVVLLTLAPSRAWAKDAVQAADCPEARQRLARHAKRLTIREVDGLALILGGYPKASSYRLNWPYEDTHEDYRKGLPPEFYRLTPEYVEDPDQPKDEYGWSTQYIDLSEPLQRPRMRAALIAYYGRTGDLATVVNILQVTHE
jgi:hypothetical protein